MARRKKPAKNANPPPISTNDDEDTIHLLQSSAAATSSASNTSVQPFPVDHDVADPLSRDASHSEMMYEQEYQEVDSSPSEENATMLTMPNDVRTLQAMVYSMSNTTLDYEKRNKALSKAIEDLRTRTTAANALLQADKQELARDLDDMQQQKTTVERDLAAEREQTREREARKEDELKGLTEQLKATQHQRDQLEESLEDFVLSRDALIQREREQDKLAEELTQMQLQKDQMAVNLKNAKDQARTAQIQYEQERAILGHERKMAKQNVDAAARKMESLEAQIESLSRANDQINEEYDALKQDSEQRRQSTNAAIEQLKPKLDQVLAERDQLGRDNQWLKGELNKSLQYNSVLIGEKAPMSLELAGLRESNGALQAKLDEKCKMLVTTENRLADEKANTKRWTGPRERLLLNMQAEMESLRKSEAAAWQMNYAEERKSKQRSQDERQQSAYAERLRSLAQQEAEEYAWANISKLVSDIYDSSADLQRTLEIKESEVQRLQGIIDEFGALMERVGGYRTTTTPTLASSIDPSTSKALAPAQESSSIPPTPEPPLPEQSQADPVAPSQTKTLTNPPISFSLPKPRAGKPATNKLINALSTAPEPRRPDRKRKTPSQHSRRDSAQTIREEPQRAPKRPAPADDNPVRFAPKQPRFFDGPLEALCDNAQGATDERKERTVLNADGRRLHDRWFPPVRDRAG